MNTKRYLQLMLPSAVSGLATVLLGSVILGVSIYSFFSGSGIIYNYLFGPNSSAELIRQSRGVVTAFTDTVFGNPVLNKILYFVFWMLIGLIVYIIMSTLLRGTSAAARDIEESAYVNKQTGELLKDFEAKLALRSVTLLVWGIYWVFFIKILLPFSIFSARIGAGRWPTVEGWLYSALGLITLALSIHIHLIFIRLFALRVRLFDSRDAVSE